MKHDKILLKMLKIEKMIETLQNYTPQKKNGLL